MFLRQVNYSFSSVVRQILNFILIPCLKTERTHTRMCNHQGSSTISSDLIEHTHCRYTADGKVCSLISLQENLWSFSCAHIFPPDVQIPSHIKQLCKSSVLESLNSLKCKYKSISQTSAQYFKINSSPDDWIWKKREILLIIHQCLSAHASLSDSGPVSLPTHLPNSYLPKEPPPRATESMSSMTIPLRGPLANSSGSPHLGNMMHPPMPPSCIMEELQRAFASKNRQER